MLTYNQLFYFLKNISSSFFYNKKNRYFIVFSNTYMLSVRYVQISLTSYNSRTDIFDVYLTFHTYIP